MIESRPPSPLHVARVSGKSKFDVRPERILMVVLCGLCTSVNYADRVNISVAIIALAAEQSLTVREQAAVLSCFFLGYIPTNFIGALLCRRLGGKAVLLYGAIGWSLFTVLTPPAARAGLPVLLACRFAMGLSEGVAFPSIFHFLAPWIPPAERSRSISFSLTGQYVGSTLALIVSPWLVAAYGWPSVFYIFGAFSFVYAASWASLARDRETLPASRREYADVIAETADPQSESDALVPTAGSGVGYRGTTGSARESAPFSDADNELQRSASVTGTQFMLQMMTNRRMLALIVSQTMYGIVHFTILSWLPTYFSKVYGGTPAQLSLTCIPYATMVLGTNAGGWASDALVRHGFTAQAARRTLMAVSATGAALMIVVFAGRATVSGAVVTISATLAFQGVSTGGFETAFLDIVEPRNVGLLKATANGMASVSGFVAAPLSTIVLDLVGGSWRRMFASLAVWYILMGVSFCTLYTGHT